MRDFLTRYRLFCAARGVDTDVDQNDIERRLKTYGCITRQIVVSRVYGLRWLRKDEAPDAAMSVELNKYLDGIDVDGTLDAELSAELNEYLHGIDDAQDVIRAFLEARCKISSAPNSWIDLETRPGPDGKIRPGFHPELFDFCKRLDKLRDTMSAEGQFSGLPLDAWPNLQEDRWETCLPKRVRLVRGQRVSQIFGITLSGKHMTPRITVQILKDRTFDHASSLA